MLKPKIHVIHENSAWVEPLREAFREIGAPFEEWFISDGLLDLSAVPPTGIYYNRMSASSHTRNHRYAAELTGGFLAWLEAHGRKVVNNGRALQLEISKIAQYTALAEFGIRVPRTIAAVGRDQILDAARRMNGAFITKHNRAGKGLGVRLFQDVDGLRAHLDTREFELSVDGITLIQEYIRAPEPFITRVEFVGGKFLYAVRVDTSQGFELCPADVCQIDAPPLAEVCPAVAPADKFQIVRDFDHPLLPKWQAFLAANDIRIAGIEFIVDESGRAFTYDVNTNTNYNPDAEAKDGRAGTSASGMGAIASYLGNLLARETRAGVRQAAPALA